jgi:hypothetical protein
MPHRPGIEQDAWLIDDSGTLARPNDTKFAMAQNMQVSGTFTLMITGQPAKAA